MQILIFDMDGVLLEPNGYHRALQETVRLVSLSLGFEAYMLTNEAIAQFESLGISSEWHSSALCMALMVIETQKRGATPSFTTRVDSPAVAPKKLDLDLRDLYSLIATQPHELPDLTRSQAAIEQIAAKAQVDPAPSTAVIRNSVSIDYSLTFNIFQELVLGSEIFEHTYRKPSQLGQESYLNRFDRSYIKPSLRKKLMEWSDHPLIGTAIMTNRPSNSLLGVPGTPEAELGAALVGLDFIPIVGSGEMTWLANRNGEDVGALLKPASYHALSAMLAATGLTADDALLKAHQIILGESNPDLSYLDQSTVYVFEDTPRGILAMDNARAVLLAQGVNIRVQKLGITKDPMKRKSLDAIGSEVFDSVDLALLSIDI